MKKFLLLIALTVSVGAFAQVADVRNADAAVSKCLIDAQDTKKSTKVDTWIKLARSYVKLYDTELGIGASFIGSTDTLLVKASMVNDPALTEEVVVIGGKPFKKRTYATHNYYFDQNNILRFAEIINSLRPDALEQAIKAYEQAAELDVKGSKTKNIREELLKINTKYRIEAETAYMLNDIKKSSVAFINATKAMEAKPLCQIDTLSVYNVAFTAVRCGDDALAKEYYKKSLDLDYCAEGMVYFYLSDFAGSEGDKDAQLKYLEDGFKRFPQCEHILFGLINYYNSNNMDPSRIFEMLEIVKRMEPDNLSTYCVEGGVYYKLGQYDKAAESFQHCIDIAPDKVDGYVQLGIMYYNRACEISTAMMEVSDATELEKMGKELKENLRLSVEPFEKVVELTEGAATEERLSALQGLKSACFQLRLDDPSYKEKYELYKGKFDELNKSE